MEERVSELFKDAECLYDMALRELEIGNVRDAAEKAWCATLRATDAVILANMGLEPIRSDLTSKRLHELRSKRPEVEVLIGRYHTRADFLHGMCFYLGICDPIEEIKRRIIETKEYIEDAKRLAEFKV